ncbi:MAG: hypothetical protein H6832_05675 [Planctomycetes bacterium]|nr:hypothetical protein [Planctomycetota bacterium]MCB9892602.1 hypothetical protein [Planctomycetota bacterium]MCB9917873.1 hypothetical protein [Planctomycetota bacterium]
MFPKIACTILATAAIAAPSFAQQNWVQNGDFASGLTGWTASGGCDAPLVESFDTTGLAASSAFGVNPGYQLNSTVQPPYVLKQNLVLPAGWFEIHLSVAMDAPGFNNDGGTISVWIGGVERAKHAWGSVPTTTVTRSVICERFLLTAGGTQTFELRFDRPYAALRGRTPRSYVDDVALRVAPGPSFAIYGDRKPGKTVSLGIQGSANVPVGIFLAPKTGPALTIPGFGGTWTLDLATTLPFFAAVTDAAGRNSTSLTYPSNLTALQGVSLYFEAVDVSNAPAIGIAHDYGLQK